MCGCVCLWICQCSSLEFRIIPWLLWLFVTLAWLSGRSFGDILGCMNFAVQTKLECVWRCRLVPARAARCATCLWTFGSVNLRQAFYLRRTTQIHNRTWTCITPRIRFNQMYFVGQQYKTNGLGFMIVSRALCIFTLCPGAFGRESAGMEKFVLCLWLLIQHM